MVTEEIFLHNKPGKNLADVQEINRSLILKLLRKNEICSRAFLAKATGLQQATISIIVSDLIKKGVVVETGFIEGEKGRRSIGIALNAEKYKVIAVKLTRQYITVALFDICGKGYEHIKEKIDFTDGSENAMKKMKAMIKTLINRNANDVCIGLGMAIPGPFMRREGRIILMTEFPGWEKIHITDELSESFHIPVILEHDANCSAIAEWWSGDYASEEGTLVSVMAGQGIGAGIIVDGKLLFGSMGIAGEIGHMSIDVNGERCICGNRGCLYRYCSTVALEKSVEASLGDYPDSVLHQGRSVTDIINATHHNDPLALAAIDKAAWYLGFGLANVANIYNPDVIVISDEMAQAGARFLDGVKSSVKEHVLHEIYENMQVVLSTLEGDSALLGAGILAVNEVLNTPSALFT